MKPVFNLKFLNHNHFSSVSINFQIDIVRNSQTWLIMHNQIILLINANIVEGHLESFVTVYG